MLRFEVNGQSLKWVDKGVIASGAVSYPVLLFELYGDWTRGKNTAIFENSNGVYHVLVNDDGSCSVPHEALTDSSFKLSLFNSNDDGRRITTNQLTLPVAYSGYKDGESPADPTPTIYEQILEALDENDRSIAVERARINNMITSGDSASADAELLDIRVGYDGATYDSAGDAVRSHGEELENIRKDMSDISINVDDLGLEQDEDTGYVYPTYRGVRSEIGIPLAATGGGGGSGVSTVIKVTNQNGTLALAAALGSPVELKFNFVSTEDDVPTGDGMCKITVNGSVKANVNIKQGLTTLDVSEYLSVGNNTVRVTCMDMYGNARSLTYSISIIELRITSTFDDSVTYDGEIVFKFTPYGLVKKTIHFIMDGEEIDTAVMTASGKQSTKNFAAMAHGVHRLEVYASAALDGLYLESNRLIYDIMCIEAGEEDILIASPFDVTDVEQGELVSIPYSVYNPASLTSDVTLVVSDSEGVYSEQNITVDRTRQTWNTRRYPIGEVTFTIKCGDASKSHVIQVAENSIDVEAVTNDLELFLTSAGRSNSEANPAVWENNGVSTVFDNFNWKSTGWLEDENGDTALRLNGDARATIQFKPFKTDFRTYGKTIELEFAVRDVNNRDAVVISCKSGEIGFDVTADTATLKSEQTTLKYQYRDEEKIRVAFVVESRNENRLMSIFLNGILSGSKQYPTNDNFQQTAPVDITIGSPYCGLDLYTVRVYNTALTDIEANNNYIADTTDIVKKMELYVDNDVYDDYSNISYDLVKDKIPVMIIVGDLPQSKGDKKNVTIKYEDPFNTDLSFEDTASIDVQGTSSQWYVVKNYKLKCTNEHQHSPGQIPNRVFCMKADYAEATGTHNTQNANYVETLYDEKTPAQLVDSRCRSTIFGFPCVIFHQATESDALEFVGKYNFNFDKGSEEVFGFTKAFDVECWEFCNNTSDACNFKGEIPESWGDDFEARYPEDCTDISRFKAMHDWVISTKDDVAKFKAEFETYFDLHFCLIYYVYTFVALMVDQRAKNMFLTYWGATGKWQPWFYDNDTSFGINNEGQLVFDYYHEDTDLLDGANVYNGQESVLWTNFRLAYPDEIKACYQELRNSGRLTYDLFIENFITNGAKKWAGAIYNEDGEYKYISMLRSEGDATNLSQIRGSGEEHFKYFVENRLNYCDSKWYASDYADDYVVFRIYTPDTYAGVAPNADITLTPFSNMYAGVRYKANGTLQQIRAEKNVPVTFEAPEETFNDTETAVYGASQLSSLGDMAPLYCGYINLSKAEKLIEIKVGDATEGYSNAYLKELSVGTNKLLKKIDVRNCPNLTAPLGLSQCPNVEEIYAAGSGITGVDLINGGYLKTLQLPGTITNLTLKNQIYISDFSMEGYDKLKTLCLENCPTIDELALLNNAKALERVRLTGVDWSFDDVSFLESLYTLGGLDENGLNTDVAHISGTCHIKELTGAERAEIAAAFPYLTITYDTIESQLIYMSEDGTTELHRETIVNGGNGSDPVSAGTISAPTKSSTAQYSYTFAGWTKKIGGSVDSTALNNVEADRYVYVAFTATVRTYTVYFYNGSTLLQTVENVPYGSSVNYTGDTPNNSTADVPEDWAFTGWDPEPTNITGDTLCYAQFEYTGYIMDDWDVIAANVANNTYKSLYNIGDLKPVTFTYDDGTTETIEMEIADFDHDDLPNGHKAGITFVAKQSLKNTLPMYLSNTGATWADSTLRNYYLLKRFNALPDVLQSVIQEVVKVSGGTKTAPNLVSTTDKLWLLSCEECGIIPSNYYTNGQGYMYPLFEDVEKLNRVDGTTSSSWWTRSGSTQYNFNFFGIAIANPPWYYYQLSRTQNYHCVFGFCVGESPIADIST